MTPLRACPTCHAWDPHDCRTCNGDGYVEDDGGSERSDEGKEPEAASGTTQNNTLPAP